MTDNVAAQFDAEMAALSGKKPETTAPVAETPVEPVANSPEPDTFDINTLPPAAKKLLEDERKKAADLDKRYREADWERKSLKGKLPHYQHDAEEWRRYKAALKKNPSAAQSPDGQQNPTAAQSPVKKEPPASLLKALPEWETHRSQYPADAAPVEAAFQALERSHQEALAKMEERFAKQEERLAQFEGFVGEAKPRFESIDEMRRREMTQAHETAQKTFAEKYPDWNTHAVVKIDPETRELDLQVSDKMGDWLDALPNFERKAYVEVLKSRDPDDAGDVQEIFARFYATLNPEPQTSQIQQQRQTNLAKRAITGQQGAGVARVDPATLDTATAFDLEMKRLQSLRK